jgi:hypothetical protein
MLKNTYKHIKNGNHISRTGYKKGRNFDEVIRGREQKKKKAIKVWYKKEKT